MSRPGDRRGRPPARGEEQKRQRITIEAARIMAEEGVRDFQAAKRKAASRLALGDTRHLPTNEEIQQALQQHLALFHGHTLADDVRRLRQLALDAMHFLAAFEPRLVGAVLSGAVTRESEIQLHLRAEAPEQIDWFLREHGIPFRQFERRVRFGGERLQTIPSYRFTADEVPVELYVFRPEQAREAPLSPVDGKPMSRASLKEVEGLLQGHERG